MLKPKLPRKRKKECIKVEGRKMYHNTVKLAKVTGECPCKFWKTAYVSNQPVLLTDSQSVVMIPTPTRFW